MIQNRCLRVNGKYPTTTKINFLREDFYILKRDEYQKLLAKNKSEKMNIQLNEPVRKRQYILCGTY
jgi:hypothetical protein